MEKPLHVHELGIQVPDGEGIELLVIHVDDHVLHVPHVDRFICVYGEAEQFGNLCYHPYQRRIVS
jgi:hypothetical protein